MLRYEFNKDNKVMRTKEEILNPLTGKSREVYAVWDTGATGTVISNDVCNELNMFVAGRSTGQVAGSKDDKPTEIVFGMLRLSNGATFTGMFTKQILPDGVDMLIGMDVITKARFSVFTTDECLVMEFGE